MRRRVYYVYMANSTDHRDDEVFKVKATSDTEARELAYSIGYRRFSVLWARSAAQTARSYKFWSTDYSHKEA